MSMEFCFLVVNNNLKNCGKVVMNCNTDNSLKMSFCEYSIYTEYHIFKTNRSG